MVGRWGKFYQGPLPVISRRGSTQLPVVCQGMQHCYLAGTAGKAGTGGCTEEVGRQEGEKMLRLCSAV